MANEFTKLTMSLQYLDCGRGQWLTFGNEIWSQFTPFNDWCGPTKSWELVYSHDPAEGLNGTEAELVLGADGVNSTVRRLLHGPNPQKRYAGYVSWRFTVPQKLVSEETARYFADNISFNFLKRSYIVWYVCPLRTCVYIWTSLFLLANVLVTNVCTSSQ